MKKKLLLLAASLISLSACSNNNKESSEKDTSESKESEPAIVNSNYRTYYQLLVYSFADGNNDGIGDFKGIVDKLDYLVDLGVEGLWLSPVLKASSYHSYDTEDYYTINPKYEVGNYNITYLLNKCHEKGIKVLMDLVLNHTSSNHTWRRTHSDWYGSDNKFGFPEFNYDKTEVREAVKDVGRYWLNQGFDGFRLDAAMWIYNSGSNRHQKNYAFWSEWCSAMKAAKSDCYLIGEVLDDDHDLAYSYANAGFDSTFDFNALGNTVKAVKNENHNFASATAADMKKARDINSNYILGRALSNHDIGRFNEEHPDSSDKAYYVTDEASIKLANAINTLTPGNTFIYYGDELGLKGTCEGTAPNWYYDMNYRTPMPWQSERTNSISYFENFHDSGKTTSTTFSGKSPEEDRNNKSSIYAELKKAIAVKNNNAVLKAGDVKTISGLDNNLNGFDVKLNNQTIRVVFNASNSSIQYSFTNSLLYSLNTSVSGKTATLAKRSLIAYSL